MKRISVLAVCVLACACMVFALTGCTKSETYTPSKKTATLSTPTIGESGTLRVGVNTGNAPLAGMSSSKIIGIDVDIAAAIADSLGLKLSIVDVGSDPEGALKNNKVDIVMGIEKSAAKDTYWVSDAYLQTGVALFATSATAGVPAKDSKATFAAQLSSKSAWAVVNEFGEANLTQTENLKEAFSSLSSGKVKYVAADAVVGSYAAHSEGVDCTIVALMNKPSGYCVAVSTGNTALQSAITNAVKTLSSNGMISLIEKKWLGVSIDLSTIPMTSAATTSTTTTTTTATNTAATGDAAAANTAANNTATTN